MLLIIRDVIKHYDVAIIYIIVGGDFFNIINNNNSGIKSEQQ